MHGSHYIQDGMYVYFWKTDLNGLLRRFNPSNTTPKTYVLDVNQSLPLALQCGSISLSFTSLWRSAAVDSFGFDNCRAALNV